MPLRTYVSMCKKIQNNHEVILMMDQNESIRHKKGIVQTLENTCNLKRNEFSKNNDEIATHKRG